ncbi:MAG: hypothetical protein GX564_05870 [Oligosphaeraceae bacterium]|nr:hypothetical protein [Oligosphaeraceae bacterium]
MPRISSLVLLCLLALLLYVPALQLRELRASDEAAMADIVRNMQQSGNYLQPQVQGKETTAFPLYPWLIALCSGGAAPGSFSVRFPAVLSIFALALLCGWMAGKYKGKLAGFVAAATVLTCCASLRVGWRGQSETLFAVLLTAAWFVWYQYGPQAQRWQRAWGYALSLVFLAVLCVGIKAVFLFYLPLFFARNPPKLLRQLQSSTHLIFLASFWAVLLLWMKGISGQPFLSWDAIALAGETLPDEGFFRHLLSFPAKALLYLLPWSLFAWAPFCLALRQFEPVGSLGGYCRALILSPLLLLWLWPGISPLLLFPILGPMAVLIGIHFEIVSSRYRQFFNLVNRILLSVALGGGCLGALFWLLVLLKKIQLFPSQLSAGWEDLAALALTAILVILAYLLVVQLRACRNNALAVQNGLLWVVFSHRALQLAIWFPLLFWTIEDRKLAGLTLAGKAPVEALSPLPDPVFGREPIPPRSLQDCPDANMVYLASPKAYLSECFYLDKRIIRIDNASQLLPAGSPASSAEPGALPVVYLLNHRYPAVPAWSWEPLSLSVNLAERRAWHFSWPSQNNSYRFVISRRWPENVSRSAGNGNGHPLRLYRGQPKN